MAHTKTYPSTKDDALTSLGATSQRTRERLAGRVEFVSVRAGRTLQTRGRFARSALVGVSGTALVVHDDNHVTEIEAPFVIDEWATDERRIATVTVVSAGPSSLLLVDWSHSRAVVDRLPRLTELSAATEDHVNDCRPDSPVAVEEVPQPVN